MSTDDDKPKKADAAKTTRRPVLTERQRIEARRRRQARRRRAHQGNVISRGLRATGYELKRTAIFLGRSVASGIAALGPVGGWIRTGTQRTAAVLVAALGFVIAAAKLGVSALGRGLTLLDRIATPRRAMLAIALVATALLVVSQFTDFRATEIGQPGYAGIEDVTTAPRVDVTDPIGSHSILLLLVAGVALAATVGATLTGRRAFGWVIASAGGVSLLVTLLLDLPHGLDAGDAAISYSGVTTILLSGFWLELSTAATLTAVGLLLPFNPRSRTRTDGRPGRTRPDLRPDGDRLSGSSSRHRSGARDRGRIVTSSGVAA